MILDYETRSEADLKKTGAYEYSCHPTTQILCASWRIGTRVELRDQMREKKRPYVWSQAFKDMKPDGLIRGLFDPSIKVVAHNALFEQVITRNVLSRRLTNPDDVMALSTLPHERWVCTAAGAASLAFPRNLEGAASAAKLPVQKDMDGRRLILKYCKPRKPTKNNSAKWHSSARDLRRIMQYCMSDVDAETYLFLYLPDMNPTERAVWLLDQKINFRGFLADRELVKKVLTMIDHETTHLNEETNDMTFGSLVSTTQRDGVLRWLEAEGVHLPDLRAKTVADALREGMVDGEAKRMLQIRQAISKTSTKKYQAFESRSRTDGRVRDILVYHAASTGRWGGSGVQPQNFPRGSIVDTTIAAEVLRLGDIELVRMLYGNPMDVFSSCLRSVIMAPEGKELFCADYAAIEARVLMWVSDDLDGLKAFRENRKIYEEMAMLIYDLERIEDVTKSQRQVGKQSELGCGYGMGWKKFVQTCKSFGIEIDDETAQVAVRAYRNKHHPVVSCWTNIERAAIFAVGAKGKKKFRMNKTTWWTDSEFLWCELPSGRRLAYYGPEIRYEMTPWDEKRPVLYHWGVNSLTKKWEQSGTYGGRLVENVVQAISRDLMADAMLRIEDMGYNIVLSVHDELLAERSIGTGNLNEFESLMAKTPAWAAGCPVKVEGWQGMRYRK